MKILFVMLFMHGAFTATAKECSYTFDLEKSQVEGTGYKFTEKTGVTAKFLTFSTNKGAAPTVDQLLQGLVVTVDLMSIDSDNVLRDQNLQEAFFAELKGDAQAIVEVKSQTADSLKTSFKINDIAKDVDFKYTKSDLTIVAEGVIDLAQHSGSAALAALASRCKSLHAGKDGQSKTWSDFAVKVTAKIKELCK